MFPQISNPNYQNSSTETKIHIPWNKKKINHFKVSYRNKTKVLCPTKGNSISNLDFQKVKQRKETKTPPSFTKSKANTKKKKSSNSSISINQFKTSYFFHFLLLQRSENPSFSLFTKNQNFVLLCKVALATAEEEQLSKLNSRKEQKRKTKGTLFFSVRISFSTRKGEDYKAYSAQSLIKL
jgi:hypothetical protein